MDISVKLPAGTLSVMLRSISPSFLLASILLSPFNSGQAMLLVFLLLNPKFVLLSKLQRIDLNGVSCPVLVSLPPPHYSNVFVYLYPYKSSDQPIKDFLGHYGEVDSDGLAPPSKSKPGSKKTTVATASIPKPRASKSVYSDPVGVASASKLSSASKIIAKKTSGHIPAGLASAVRACRPTI